jgi:glycosyltransferase involved in cell wall biosynthesis
MDKQKKLREIGIVSASDLFDEAWYLDRYPDVAALGLGAAEHYLRIGARLTRNPGPAFDTAYYLASNVDVANAGINPLVHYAQYGRREGRRCVPDAASAAALPRVQPPAMSEPPLVVKTVMGDKARNPGARTVLVCAHIAGSHLFGSERSLLDVLDGFGEMGLNVVVTIPGGGGDYLKALRARSFEVISFRYGWWTRDVPVDEQVVAEFARIIALHEVDAVHVNTIMLREPLIASRRLGARTVLHARELITHDVALLDRIGDESAAIVDAIVEGTDWIIANSAATGACFAKSDRTIVVPNTADEALLDVAPPSLAAERATVGMVSSNIPKKGIDDFVAMAILLRERLPGVRFLLVGPENRFTKAMEERQLAGELPGNIEFPGYSPSPADALSQCDIVVNFSHFQESFGRTVLEAMSASRPVVAYDWGALPELVEDGVSGYIVPFRDVEAAAARVEHLCAHRDFLTGMGAEARARAKRLYSVTCFRENLRQAYERIFSDDAVPAKIRLPARAVPTQASVDRPLRIAYFLWHFPVPSETFVLNELRILIEQGHDVHVYCRQSPYEDFAPDFDISWTRVTDPGHLAGELARTRREIVHSHFTYPTVTEMVWPACESAGVPFTFIAHAQDIFRHVNVERNRIGEIARSPQCLRVLVPSKFHRDYVERHGVPAEKILINPNGIDPSLYDQGQGARHAQRQRRKVCAIHRFTEKKGLSNLIAAAPALAAAGIELHLYGYGDLEDDYRRQVRELGADNVHLHGAVKDRREMLAVFEDSDLFACPSVRASDGDMDGIPTVLMEAMASGLPVLATSLSGIPDLVQDGVTGIVCKPDADGVADAVLHFYAMPEPQVRSMIEDARRLVRENFNAQRLTGALVRLWRRQTIDLMIVSWNNLPQLHEVVRRLCKYTMMPWHLVICDNGSSRDVLAFLCDLYASYDNVTIVLNRDNAFVGPGTNICLANGGSDYAVYVCGKEGFVLGYGWEKPLIEYMDDHPDVGQAGTLCYSPSYLTGGRYPEAIPEFPKFRNQHFARDNAERKFAHVQGGLFVLRRAMVDEIGGFSSDVPHNYTDVEFSYYVESRGWKLGSSRGLLALYNKTRPGLFSRFDESVGATHPPMLRDLEVIDKIASMQTRYCNLCDWNGPAFAGEDGGRCPACGSSPADRTLYRFLAESMLTYRRLPALGVGIGRSMDPIWKAQFQGQLHDGEAMCSILESEGKLTFNNGSIRVVYFAPVDAGASVDDRLLRECDRILSEDGIMLLRDEALASMDLSSPQLLDRISKHCRFHSVDEIRYRSRVLGYDSVPLHVFRRAGAEQCVS